MAWAGKLTVADGAQRHGGEVERVDLPRTHLQQDFGEGGESSGKPFLESFLPLAAEEGCGDTAKKISLFLSLWGPLGSTGIPV